MPEQPVLRRPLDERVEEGGGDEDEQQIGGGERPRQRVAAVDEHQREAFPQQRMAEIGREADLPQPMEDAPAERVARRVGGERQREQQGGERGGDARRLDQRAGAEQRQDDRRRSRRDQRRAQGCVTPAQPQGGDRAAADELGHAAQQAEMGDVVAHPAHAPRGHQQGGGPDHQRDREQERRRRQPPPVDPHRQQREQQIGEQLATD